MPSYRTQIPTPPAPPATYYEALCDALDHYVTTEVYVVVLVVAAAMAIGRYGLYAVVTAPVTFAVWLYHAVRSFRFKPVIIAFGTTEDELADRTADKVLSKANTEAAKQRGAPAPANGGGVDDVDAAAGDQQQPGAPNSAQRAGLRNRARAQQAPDSGAV